MIGVLGGMGPAATVDFMAKTIRVVPATRDQEHVPLLVLSDPRIPDRVGPILHGRGPSPLAAMVEGVRRLEAGGAQAIVMPCHTAHAWAPDRARATPLPFLSIVDATLEAVELMAPRGPIGLLATRATLAAGLYQARLEAAGRPPLLPDERATEDLVLPAILKVKQNRADAAAPMLRGAIDELAAQGALAVLLACTELPVAFDVMADDPPVPVVDATLALARTAVEWWSRC
jgi:aspartate racemase